MAAAVEAWPWKNSQGILVSPMDKRHYRWLRLPNGLQVRLVAKDPDHCHSSIALRCCTLVPPMVHVQQLVAESKYK